MPDAANTDWFPLDPAEHEAQVVALLRRLGDASKRVLDLGCGDGRVALPLARAGHRVVALDSDPQAVRRCAAAHPGIEPRLGDILDPLSLGAGAALFDAVLCLGHTFMLLHDPPLALGLLGRLRGAVLPGGFLALDDFAPLWAEVACGNWQTGISEDGGLQIVWAEADNVIALRAGSAVDQESWSVREGDRLHRLWSLGELRLLAAASGWGPPVSSAADHLTVLTLARA